MNRPYSDAIWMKVAPFGVFCVDVAIWVRRISAARQLRISNARARKV